MPGEIVRLTLPVHVVQEVARRAEQCGLAPGPFVRQVVESYLAGERCRHLGPSPHPAESDADLEGD